MKRQKDAPLNLDQLAQRWPQLHHGDGLVWPQDLGAQEAWLLFHQGAFERAVERGLAAGGAGLNAANKAQCFIARRLADGDSDRMALLQAVADRAAVQLMDITRPLDAQAQSHFWRGLALLRYCQGLNVAKALALGLILQAKTHLELAVMLAPRHADALLALAGFHAEMIDKVGPLIAQLSYGANAQAALRLLGRVSALQVRSAAGLIEQARALVLLQGNVALAQAKALYEQAARLRPLDAAERLDIELARSQLGD
jgi:hypothetical protein